MQHQELLPLLNLSERRAISPELNEILGERRAEQSGITKGANTHVSGERKFSPLSSA